MRRAAPVLLCFLLVLSGFCTNLCAMQQLAELQHPCCPQHHSDQDSGNQGGKSCGHSVAGQDAQAVLSQISPDAAPPALLPQAVVFPAPLMALFSEAPSAPVADLSPQRHFVLRL